MRSIQLLENDDSRAVSPVIGVILMVAITVILAAVIGAFVLGLGEQVGQSTPQASLGMSVSASSDTITLEHDGGDTIEAANTRLVVEVGSTTYEVPAGSSNTVILQTGGKAKIANDATPVIAVDWNNDGTYDSTGSNQLTIASGDKVTVTVVDTASGRVVAELSTRA